MTMSKYPTFKKTIRLRHDNDLHIQATVDFEDRPIVEIFSTPNIQINMAPSEAERLARALVKSAKVSRAKIAFREKTK